MKRLLAILLMGIMSFGFLTKSFILIEYYTFQKFYIEKYCENKDKPELNCKGKCHLSKSMSEEMPVEKDGWPRPKLVEDFELSLCILEPNQTLMRGPVDITFEATDFTINILSGFAARIEQPPEIS